MKNQFNVQYASAAALHNAVEKIASKNGVGAKFRLYVLQYERIGCEQKAAIIAAAHDLKLIEQEIYL